MPTNVGMQIPFLPQESISQSILAAIQLANVQATQQRQLALQQQAQPSEIAQREAEARRLDAQTELDKMSIQMRRELFGALTGNTPGGVPTPTAQPASATPNATTVAPGGTAPVTGGAGPSLEEQVAMYGPNSDLAKAVAADRAKPAQSGADLLRAAAARGNQPAPAAENPSGLRGIIGQTVDSLLRDPNLKPEDKTALLTSGRLAIVKALQDPATAMDSITTTYNDILRRRSEMERTIHTEVKPDSQSSA